jgi:hypothetical protein
MNPAFATRSDSFTLYLTKDITSVTMLQSLFLFEREYHLRPFHHETEHFQIAWDPTTNIRKSPHPGNDSCHHGGCIHGAASADDGTTLSR